MTHHRLAAFAAAAIVALGAAPATAAAAPSKVDVWAYDGDPNFGPDYSLIALDADPRDSVPHKVSARPAGDGTHLISDSAGIVLAPVEPGGEQECAVVDATTVRCAHAADYDTSNLEFSGGAGADVVNLRAAGTQLTGSVSMRLGADRVLGSPGPDYIDGGRGRDVLIGYAGMDSIDGGRGADTIRARDGEADGITCGRGDDRREKAIRDRFDRGLKVWLTDSDWYRRPISC